MEAEGVFERGGVGEDWVERVWRLVGRCVDAVGSVTRCGDG